MRTTQTLNVCGVDVSVEIDPQANALHEMYRLLKEARGLEPETKPWRVDVMENVGDNWMIADTGLDHDGKQYIVTTDRVRASETRGAGPKADAEFIVWCRNNMGTILAALEGYLERAGWDLGSSATPCPQSGESS